MGVFYLLDVGGESEQRLGVGKQRPCPMTKERGVPNAQEAHQHRDVLAGVHLEEMVVHVVGAIQETPGDFEAVVQRDGKDAYGGANAVPV